MSSYLVLVVLLLKQIIPYEIYETLSLQVCGSKANGRCRKEYFPDIVKEIERRHFMEEKIKWDFRALDVENKGRISLESALFLFKAVHGDKFSQRYWNLFEESRLDPYSDVYFDEIKLCLCNIPEFASSNGDQEFRNQKQQVRENAKEQLEEELKILTKLQVCFFCWIKNFRYRRIVIVNFDCY